jgi:hypothetical protein
MSQSDYIRHKRISNELANGNLNNAPSVFNAGQYISYKEYSLENTILNSSISYNHIIPPNIPVVFGIQYNNASSCPPFILCTNTNTRPNRKPLMNILSQPAPLRPIVEKTLITDLKLCKCVNI